MFETTYRQEQPTSQDNFGYHQDFMLHSPSGIEHDVRYTSGFVSETIPDVSFHIANALSTYGDTSGEPYSVSTAVDRTTSRVSDAHNANNASETGLALALQNAQDASFSLSNELTSTPSALCGYFFKEVITLYCAWDGQSNHMRFLLENMWQKSASLYHTIQSMAAACLADDFPQLSSVAAREHTNALACLRDQSGSIAATEDNLLSLMLLGQTASWHSPNDLAIERFRTIQNALDKYYRGSRQDETSSFFNDAMNYWAMLLAFLTDDENLADEDGNDPIIGPESPSGFSLPHPICGTARDIVKTLADVGTLVFRFRKQMSTMKFMSEEDVRYFRDSLGKARRLERVLLEYTPTDPSRVLDPGDPRTPLMHFHHINEAYRCTGLLQLYRVFPDMLTQRYRPWSKEDLLNPQLATETPTEEQRNLWLTKLAMHILGHLREIPFESRTRSVQPFIFVAVSSELRLNPGADFQGGNMSHFFIEVARARKFVSSRLSAYMHILPLRKVRVIFELVTSMWAELDAGKSNIYWVDFAFQKRLGTIMG